MSYLDFQDDLELYNDYHRGALITVELGTLVKNGFDLGLQTYPIFDENYRNVLNEKIIEHYFFREIGAETPEMFKRFLNRKMNEIMPVYNKLYRACLVDFDPFQNYEMLTDATTEASSESEATGQADDVSRETTEQLSDSDTKSRSLVSATPQMQLSGHDDYATNITDNQTDVKATGSGTSDKTSSTTQSSKENASSLNNYVSKVSGISGITKSQALTEFREALINVDMEIIEELNVLFCGIYSNGFSI